MKRYDYWEYLNSLEQPVEDAHCRFVRDLNDPTHILWDKKVEWIVPLEHGFAVIYSEEK